MVRRPLSPWEMRESQFGPVGVKLFHGEYNKMKFKWPGSEGH